MKRPNNTKLNNNVDTVLEVIKSDIRTTLETDRPMSIPVELCDVKKTSDAQQSILYAEELNYLNANWANWDSTLSVSSHRKLIGPIVVKIKRVLAQFITEFVMKGYFERERQFNMNLVKHLNASARYIEARNADSFWQLINKVDSDIQNITKRVDYLFAKSLEKNSELEAKTLGSLEKVEKLISEKKGKEERS